MMRFKILFVCLGNICRSPMAEALMNKLIEEKNLSDLYSCDSAGTSNNHVGENPDPRTIVTCDKNEVLIHHKARQITVEDFNKFDLLIAMDESNFLHLNKMAESKRLKNYHIRMMREFDNKMDSINVADPWFGDMKDFDLCYETLYRNCEAWLEHLTEHTNE